VDNYIAVIFDSDNDAVAGFHELWNLDNHEEITVHGAAVIRRDEDGHVDVATKRTDPGVRTVVGIGLGALMGALAAPVVAAGGAAVAAATTAAVGATFGGVAGLTADGLKSDEHERAVFESGFVMKPGQSAVVAEVTEDSPTPVDTAMKRLGGTVFRRDKSTVRDDSLWGGNSADYLYPYEYDPYFPQPRSNDTGTPSGDHR
jgi:uncharacterized membrane protein